MHVTIHSSAYRRAGERLKGMLSDQVRQSAILSIRTCCSTRMPPPTTKRATAVKLTGATDPDASLVTTAAVDELSIEAAECNIEADECNIEAAERNIEADEL